MIGELPIVEEANTQVDSYPVRRKRIEKSDRHRNLLNIPSVFSTEGKTHLTTVRTGVLDRGRISLLFGATPIMVIVNMVVCEFVRAFSVPGGRELSSVL